MRSPITNWFSKNYCGFCKFCSFHFCKCLSIHVILFLRSLQEHWSRCWFVGDNLTGDSHVLRLQLSPLITSIILSSNNIQNGDILCPAYPSCHGQWPFTHSLFTLCGDACLLFMRQCRGLLHRLAQCISLQGFGKLINAVLLSSH